MTTVLVPDAVRALLEAAATGTLLSGAESLAAALTVAGWAPRAEGGVFGIDGWNLRSSAWAPGLSVFSDGDETDARRRAQAVASFLSAHPDRWTFHTDGADWSRWTMNDPQWAEGDWMAIHPLEWHGGGVVLSLYVRPDYQPGKVRVPANLHLAIERTDTPADGLPRDDERSRRVQREGSVVERWYLAAEQELPGDVITALDVDPSARVRAAAEAGRWLRERTVVGPPPVGDAPIRPQPPARFTLT